MAEQIDELAAKVTALTMLVEALYVDAISRAPGEVSEGMIESVLNAEEAVRRKVGETDYALRISEAVTSLIDRATAKASLLRGTKSPD